MFEMITWHIFSCFCHNQSAESVASLVKGGLHCKIFAIKDYEPEYWLVKKTVFANNDAILPTLCAFHELNKL